MPSYFDLSREDGYCLPGDFTVTRMPFGYVIGRALPRHGLGPWWTYITIVTSELRAVELAREMASSAGARAWLHLGGEEYAPIVDSFDGR